LFSVTYIKLQFPEDRAVNSITKEILVDLRQYGCRSGGGGAGKNKTKRKTNKNHNKGNKTAPVVNSSTPDSPSSTTQTVETVE
jgi:hypothetical protein